MISLEKACELYESTFPKQIVDTILDIGDEWVISGRDKDTMIELDTSPIAIAKVNGKMRTFFPPANMNKLKNAKLVERQQY